MTPIIRSFLLSLLLLVVSGVALAQESQPRHPLLENRFNASLGAFVMDKSLKVSVDGRESVSGDDIDFGDQWKLGSSSTRFAGEFTWRFGEKWSLGAQYFDSSDSGRATLTEDIGWGDYVLKEGSNVGAGLSLKVARFFLGRKFSEGPSHEFGAGLGFHWMEIGAFVDGELFINDESTGVRKESVSASAPLPNLGVWYDYAFSPRWLGSARLDWLDVSFDEYSGQLLNGSVSVNYMPFERIGFSLAYQYFGLDVDVDKGSWKGGVDISYNGPFISVTATW